MSGPIVRAVRAVPPTMPSSVGYEVAWAMARERSHLFLRIRDAELRDATTFSGAERLKFAYGDRIVTQVAGL